MADISVPKIPIQYECKMCNYISSSKKDYSKHILTRKHKNTYNGLTNANNISQKSQQLFQCECGKKYKHRQSLHKHRYHFHNDAQSAPSTLVTDPAIMEKMIAMFTQVLTQNQDFMQNVIGKVQGINTNSYNNNNNNNNNTNQFNIQMFLNQHCKNAMNISDFIKSLPITAQHYENTKDHGLTDTLTNIIVDGLNNLDIVQRPIHCTDKKRKVIYVKDNDIWEKDDNNNLILKNLKALSAIHGMNLYIWQDDNPKYETVEKLQLEFADIISNLYTNIFQERKHVNKIINNLSNSTYLDDDYKLQYSNYDTLTSL
jgi:hypothetical protein